MSNQNPTASAPTSNEVNSNEAEFESALDTEQAEAKSNITITESAQGYLAELLSKQDTDGIGVRIFVEHPMRSRVITEGTADCKLEEKEGPGSSANS